MANNNQNSSIEAEIINNIHRIYKQAASTFLSSNPCQELSFGKLHALRAISEGHKSISEIAKDLGVTLPTATVIVNKIEATKLAKRLASKQDRRVTEMAITKKGEKLLNKCEEAKESHVKTFLAKLSATDKETLAKILRKLSDSI